MLHQIIEVNLMEQKEKKKLFLKKLKKQTNYFYFCFRNENFQQ